MGMRRLVRVGLQYFFGLMLLVASVGKLLDNRHFAEILFQWQLFPRWSLLTIGIIASLSELILAIGLFSGKYLPLMAIATSAFHFGYAGMTAFTLLRGISLPDCGCFGIFSPHPLDWVMVWEDSGLALLALFLYYLAKTSVSLKESSPRKTQTKSE